MSGLLKAFQEFWSLKSEKYLKGLIYHEAGPHILLSAFLQRVVNGGAMVIEEYAIGTGYSDIDVQYAGQHYVIELKIKGSQSLDKSLEQIARYMDGCLATEGWLVVFDKTPVKASLSDQESDVPTTWRKKISWETRTLPGGLTVHVVGC